MWNLVYSNKTCNEYNRFREHKEFLERLSKTRHVIDTTTPNKPKFFEYHAKKKVMKRETERKINYENKVLYNKMYELSTKPSPYSPSMLVPSRCPAFDRVAIDFKERKRLNDIAKCNKKLKKRFQSAKPHYNTSDMMKESSYNNYLKKNISNFSINPNINYATYDQFKKNLTIATERDDNKRNDDMSCYTICCGNKKDIQSNCNFSTISDIRPVSSRSAFNAKRTIEYKKPYSGKTRVTNSTIANTTNTLTK